MSGLKLLHIYVLFITVCLHCDQRDQYSISVSDSMHHIVEDDNNDILLLFRLCNEIVNSIKTDLINTKGDSSSELKV